MNNGILYSILLHICFAFFIFFKLPIAHEDLSQENSIVIDIVDIAEVTNLPNHVMPTKNIETKDETVHTKKEEKKEDIAPPPPPPQETQEVKEEIKPTPEPPKPVVAEQPKAEVSEPIKPKKENIEKKAEDKKVKDPPKKPVTSTEKDKKKKPNDDWSDSVLKSIKTSSKEKQTKNIYEEVDEIDKAIKSHSDVKYNKQSPMTISYVATIKKRVNDYWKRGAFRGMKTKVDIIISLDENGKVLNVDVLGDPSNKDPRYPAYIASAKRAAYDASPFPDLPKQDYEILKKIKLVFEPQD